LCHSNSPSSFDEGKKKKKKKKKKKDHWFLNINPHKWGNCFNYTTTVVPAQLSIQLNARKKRRRKIVGC
jgi:hypothetical protein